MPEKTELCPTTVVVLAPPSPPPHSFLHTIPRAPGVTERATLQLLYHMMAAVNAAGVLASVILLLSARAGAFVVPCSSRARAASCVPVSLDGRRASGGIGQVEARSQLRCGGGLREPPQAALFSSWRGHQRNQQRRRRRRERPTTTTAFPAATATTRGESSAAGFMNARRCGANEEAGEEDEIPQEQPRRRHQTRGSGQQQTRADFLKGGASVAGFAAVVLGGQQQVPYMMQNTVRCSTCKTRHQFP